MLDPYDAAKHIVKTLIHHGFTAYFAGGWVRDFLLGRPSYDIDIATNASAEQIMQIFDHTVAVGAAFGVVVVIIEGVQFEVASFRKDLEYKDGRHPEKIEQGTPQEDALRRDFTINGLFYDPITEKIYDFVNGKRDLQLKIIRTIGNPKERFLEDRLRLIRGIRFACQLHFTIEPQTEKAIQEHAPLLFPAVAIERVWQELCKIKESLVLDQALLELHRLNLLKVIFPSLDTMTMKDLKKIVSSFPSTLSDTPTILYLIQLFEDASLSKWLEMGAYLKIKNRELQQITTYWNARKLLLQPRECPELVQWAHFYADPDSEIFLHLFYSKYEKERAADELQCHRERRFLLQDQIKRIQQKTPLVTSFLLKENGIFPGKIMGQLLQEAERIAVNLRLECCQDVLLHLKKSKLWP